MNVCGRGVRTFNDGILPVNYKIILSSINHNKKACSTIVRTDEEDEVTTLGIDIVSTIESTGLSVLGVVANAIIYAPHTMLQTHPDYDIQQALIAAAEAYLAAEGV